MPTLSDIRDYLSYSVKIYELTRKFTWESVLSYDDEYRVLQHVYGYPWCFDQSHLHEIVLVPRYFEQKRTVGGTSKSSGTLGGSASGGGSASNYATRTTSGLEICRNFNRQKGCVKPQCKFVQACNRLVGSQACGKQHPGHMHSNAALPSA